MGGCGDANPPIFSYCSVNYAIILYHVVNYAIVSNHSVCVENIN